MRLIKWLFVFRCDYYWLCRLNRAQDGLRRFAFRGKPRCHFTFRRLSKVKSIRLRHQSTDDFSTSVRERNEHLWQSFHGVHSSDGFDSRFVHLTNQIFFSNVRRRISPLNYFSPNTRTRRFGRSKCVLTSQQNILFLYAIIFDFWVFIHIALLLATSNVALLHGKQWIQNSERSASFTHTHASVQRAIYMWCWVDHTKRAPK